MQQNPNYNHYFFAGNHPIYQNIIFKDELDNILMPSELSVSFKDWEYRLLSRRDALLEEVNNESKACCKLGGIPTESQWIRVFRNLDKLNEVNFFFSIKYTLRKSIFV